MLQQLLSLIAQKESATCAFAVLSNLLIRKQSVRELYLPYRRPFIAFSDPVTLEIIENVFTLDHDPILATEQDVTLYMERAHGILCQFEPNAALSSYFTKGKLSMSGTGRFIC